MALTKISTGMLKQDAASSDLNIDAGTLYIDVSNNRVGVNNTSPSFNLDVSGTGQFTGSLEVDSSILTRQKLQISNGRLFEVKGTSSAFTIRDGSAAADRVTILAGGNVGIGTTNPAQKLVVANGTNGQGLEIVPGTTNIIQSYNRNASAYIPLNIDVLNLRVRANDASETALRVDTNGRVGIGTDSPGYPLEISAEGTVSLAYQRTGTGVTAKKWGFHSDNSNTYWQNITDSLLAITVSNAGNVGIGATSPQGILQVNGGSSPSGSNWINFYNNGGGSNPPSVPGGIVFGWNKSNGIGESIIAASKGSAGGSGAPRLDFALWDASTSTYSTPMIINSSGNVGIGTDAPSVPLHVDGSVKIDTASGESFEIYRSAASNFKVALGTANAEISSVASINIKPSGTTIQKYQLTADDFILNGPDLSIGTSSPINSAKLTVYEGKINAGTDTSVGGSVTLENYYANGVTAAWGATRSSGGAAMLYGVYPSTTAQTEFTSSTGIALNRGAYVIDDVHRFYAGSNQTVTVGSNVTMSEVMRIESDGKVGINEQSPNAYLHITGKTSYTTANSSEVSGLGFVRLQPNSDSEHSLWVHNAGNNLGISGYTNATTSSPRDMTLQTYGGKVIIGATSSDANDLLQIETPASGGGHGIHIRRNDSNSDQNIGRILFGNASDNDLAMMSATTDGAVNNARLGFFTQAAGGALTERLRIDNEGILGVGVTPSTGWSGYDAIQIGPRGSINANSSSANAFFGLANNGYYDGTNWRYIAGTIPPTQYQMTPSGTHAWYNAAAGTAGNVITYSQDMTLHNNGNLGLGTGTASIASALSGSNKTFKIEDDDGADIRLVHTGGVDFNLGVTNSNTAYIWNVGNHKILFGTNNTERMRLHASGNLSLNANGALTSIDGVSPSIQIGNSATTTAGIALENQYNGWVTYLTSADGKFSIWDSTSNADRFTIDTNGKIGIRNTSPTNELHLGSGQANFIRIHNAGSGDVSSGISITRGDALGLQIYDNPQDDTSTFNAEGNINFRTSNQSYRLYIKDNGNVSIGTTDQASRLNLNGPSSGSLPVFDIQTTGSGSFMRGVRMLGTQMATGNDLMYAVGAADSSRNMGQMYFNYSGTSGSTENSLRMGLHSVDHMLNLWGSGDVGIGKGTGGLDDPKPRAPFHVKTGGILFNGVGDDTQTTYDNNWTWFQCSGVSGTYSTAVRVTIPDVNGSGSSSGYGSFSMEVYVSGYDGRYCHAYYSGYVNTGLSNGELATRATSSGTWTLSAGMEGTQGFYLNIAFPGSLVHPSVYVRVTKGGHQQGGRWTDLTNANINWT